MDILLDDTSSALAGQRGSLMPGATAARRKIRRAKQTMFAQMPVKLLEAERADALQAQPKYKYKVQVLTL
jgi:hypothetical protein